jgi:hypothetical protein
MIVSVTRLLWSFYALMAFVEICEHAERDTFYADLVFSSLL